METIDCSLPSNDLYRRFLLLRNELCIFALYKSSIKEKKKLVKKIVKLPTEKNVLDQIILDRLKSNWLDTIEITNILLDRNDLDEEIINYLIRFKLRAEEI